jgi:uncharacterized membrane protein
MLGIVFLMIEKMNATFQMVRFDTVKVKLHLDTSEIPPGHLDGKQNVHMCTGVTSLVLNQIRK